MIRINKFIIYFLNFFKFKYLNCLIVYRFEFIRKFLNNLPVELSLYLLIYRQRLPSTIKYDLCLIYFRKREFRNAKHYEIISYEFIIYWPTIISAFTHSAFIKNIDFVLVLANLSISTINVTAKIVLKNKNDFIII